MTVRLFVGNLDPRTSAQQLSRFFASAGIPVSAQIAVDPQTGRSRGFGFVDLSNDEQVEHAMIVFDGRKLGNRELRLEPAVGASGQRRRPHDRPRRTPWQDDDEDEQPDSGREGRRKDDDASHRQGAKRRHGKHGSDRIRGRGTRRVIE